jgi:hypothetical protein
VSAPSYTLGDRLADPQQWRDGGNGMATFTVQQGKRYRATISLGFIERLAGNETIADRLRQAGFAEVRVSGTGATRYAEGLWASADATAEMPAQIASVSEIA